MPTKLPRHPFQNTEVMDWCVDAAEIHNMCNEIRGFVSTYDDIDKDVQDMNSAEVSEWASTARERLWQIREVENKLFNRRTQMQTQLEKTLKWNDRLSLAVEGERSETENERTKASGLEKSRSQKVEAAIDALLKVCSPGTLIDLIEKKSRSLETSREHVDQPVDSVPDAIIDELFKQFSFSDEVDRWNVDTVVEVIRKAGRRLRKGKQVDVQQLSSIASSPLPDAQPRGSFNYAPSPLRSSFATPVRPVRKTALLEAPPPPPMKMLSTSRGGSQDPGRQAQQQRTLNHEETQNEMDELKSRIRRLELDVASCKEEIGTNHLEIAQLRNEKAFLQSSLLDHNLFHTFLDQHTMITFAEDLRYRLQPPVAVTTPKLRFGKTSVPLANSFEGTEHKCFFGYIKCDSGASYDHKSIGLTYVTTCHLKVENPLNYMT
jgi:hypothetical protein